MKTEDNQKELLPNDETIVDMYWQRNEEAIQVTDKKYGKFLFTIANNIVHDRLDSEECVNDTYLGVWNKIPPAKPNVFKMFIAKITRNISIDRFRSKNAQKHVPSEMMTSLEELDGCLACDLTVEEEYEVRELSRVLNSYLRTLNGRNEFIFVCRYYFSDTIATIAAMLRISEATVYNALAKMRAELRKCLEQEGYLDEKE